ncbi:MAG: lysylphosphatidylglycerol synthase domain-containing protein [Allosphingosinicella sp.]|uniref:lysylphosphatidylglycerol synthase domain-containing protein n=1 Tax=Allosphingosinicella sp. TaxID=2823234 RepID=UPI0039598397
MRRLVALVVSLVLLAVIWWQVDARAMVAAIGAADPLWLGLGLAAVMPLTLGTAWRFALLGRSGLGIGTATRLILSSSTLNLVLPSKMGDLTKAWVLARRHGWEPKRAIAIVVIEKMLDMAALLLLGGLALLRVADGEPLLLLAALAVAGLLLLLLVLLSPLPLAPWAIGRLAGLLPAGPGAKAAAFAAQWRDAVGWFWNRPARAASIAALSLALWAGHLAQFWLFATALGQVPFIDNMAFATLAILAGLMPLTMAGIGTRDAAIVLFYRPWLEPASGAALGVLATLRYVLPALAGLLFVRDYWQRPPPQAGS